MTQLNYNSIKELFEHNGVTELYHVTDSSNWDNIKKNGLLSIDILKERGIQISASIGDDVSRKIDSDNDLTSYIHLSFCEHAPCLDAAIECGKLDENHIILKFSIDILKNAEFIIYPKHHGLINSIPAAEVSDLERIPWNILTSECHNIVSADQRQYLQAEILIKDHIPANLILNYQDIDLEVGKMQGGEKLERCCIAFLVEESLAMERSVSVNHEPPRPISFTVREMINEVINHIAIRNKEISYECGISFDRYDVAVIGYGDQVRSMWNDPYNGSDLISIKDLKNTMISMETTSYEPNLSAGLNHVRDILDNWVQREGFDNMRPILIHITEGSHFMFNTELAHINIRQLNSIQTRRGNIEIWNILFSPHHSSPILFPGIKDTDLLSPIGTILSNISSPLSERMIEQINDLHRFHLHEAAEPKAMLINANLAEFASVLIR